MKAKKILVYAGGICAMIFGLANAGQHPVSSNSGYTGAPGDSVCSTCHSGGNSSLDGDITISGLPATIMTGSTYNITVTVSNPNGNAVKAGFQLLALNGLNGNAGNLANNMPLSNTSIRMVSGGKKYFGHLNAQDFPASNTLEYTVDWTAPPTTGTNPVIKFYAAAVVANGNNNNGQDLVVTTNVQVPIQGPATGVSASITNVQGVLCAGTNTGSALAVATGGTSPYSYQWSNSVTTAQNTTLPAGTATVTITDASSTSATATTTITAPAAITLSASSSPACSGGSNGAAFATGSGGTGSLSYLWSNGVAGQSNSNLSAGTYTVTVTDANGCTKATSTTVNSVANPTVTTTAVGTTCGQNNGSISTTVTGSSGPYTFNWTGGLTGQNPVNVPPGTYTVTVTQNTSGCTGTSTATVSTSAAMLASGMVTQTTCGQNNGAILLTVTGGTAPYTYSWTSGLTGPNPSNVGPGTYTVTVTGSGLAPCTATTQVTVNGSSGVSVANIITQPSCGLNNGGISLSVAGGTFPYSYNWTGGLSGFNPVNVAPGTYTVTVSDSGNPVCSTAKTYTLNPSTSVTITGTSVNESCLGAANGALAISVTGGTTPYLYNWSNGATTTTITGLISGQYTVTVTDGDGCTKTSMVTVGANASFALTLVNKTNIVCHGDSTGSATVTFGNPLTYIWSNGYTGATLTNAPAGVYTVVGTDLSGCSSIPLSVSITQPPAIQALTTAFDNLLCPGDSNGYFDVVLQGGTGSLTYAWSNGEPGLSPDSLVAGTYTITVTDMNNCSEIFTYTVSETDAINIDSVSISTPVCFGENEGSIELSISGGYGVLDYDWSPSAAANDSLYNLAAGVYQLTITDEQACEKIDSFIVTQPDSLYSDLQIINESVSGAHDGKIIATPVGGTGPYSIVWSTGESTFTIDSLSPGIYYYTLSDGNDCYSAGFGVVGGGGCSLSLDFSTESPTCFNTFDGTIHLTVNGGFQQYDIQVFKNNTMVSHPLDSLDAGTYSLIVTDSLGCVAILPSVVLSPLHPAIVLDSIIKTAPSSMTSKDGSLEALASGGSGDLTFEWFKEGILIGESQKINGLGIGIYTLVVIDAQGCELTLSSIFLEAASSTTDQGLTAVLKSYPNPFDERLVLENKSDHYAIEISISDIHGRTIRALPDLAPHSSMTIDAEDTVTQNGIYVLEYKISGHRTARKLVRMSR